MTYTMKRSDDSVKRDLELVCDTCEHILCDVEDGDTVGLLAETCAGHDRFGCIFDDDEEETV
jgi:hypothetical protein